MTINEIVIARTEAALKEIAHTLDRDPHFERLSKEEIESKGEDYISGWRTTTPIADIDCELEILVPPFFPDEPPDIFISASPERFFLKNPHVERNGKICLFSSSASIDADAPIDLVGECLNRAREILTSAPETDFRDEALIYWSLAGGSHQYLAYLCSPIEKLRDECTIAVTGKLLVVASDATSATKWLQKWKGWHVKPEFFAPCRVARVDTVFLPSEYPSTLFDVRSLLCKYSPDSTAWFEEFSSKTTKLFGVVFVQQSHESEILAGVITYGQGLDGKKKLTHGFRPGHTPSRLLWTRGKERLRTKKVNAVNIIRTDSEWIHSRGGAGINLSQTRVTLIGCGSLGGYVGHLLARAGVGTIKLLDNDTLDWGNVGRHLLGASDVGKSKSEALATRLQSELPHLEITHFSGDWRDWIKQPDAETEFVTSDLVISTVADWRCERPLNSTIRKIGNMDAIYAWLEPYGFAAQVLITRDQGGCLECGMDGLGNFQHRAIDFEQSTLRKEPGGCAYYQQYGPTKIVPLAGLIVDAAVEVLSNRVSRSELWTTLGTLEELPRFGGSLRGMYQEDNEPQHSKTLKREWAVAGSCPCCNRKAGI